MGREFSFINLVEGPDVEFGDFYLSKLTPISTERYSRCLANEIIQDFPLRYVVDRYETLAIAGCNFAISILCSLLESHGWNIQKIKMVRKAAALVEVELTRQNCHGHRLFAKSYNDLLITFNLLYEYLEVSLHNEKSTETLSAVSDLLAIAATNVMTASHSCKYLARIIDRSGSDGRILKNYVLELNADSVKGLSRRIPELEEDSEVGLSTYKDLETLIWKAKDWELLDLYNKAMSELRAISKKRPVVVKLDRTELTPSVFPPLAIRPQVRMGIVALQDWFC